MAHLCAILLVSLFICPVVSAADPSISPNNPQALRETNRLLEEEVKLAGHSQTYLLLDLPAQTIVIKGRGLELHRLPLLKWETFRQGLLAGVYRLKERPPVVRPKAIPATDQNPIELKDMPAAYELGFDPPLVIAVSPPPSEHLWLWAYMWGKAYWMRMRSWWLSEDPLPYLRLILPTEQTQSLAWSLIDRMPVLIRQPNNQ
ncbi:MAG: hypothetical protein ACT4OO_13485 [Nitrospiraceae bacterium]